MLDHHSLVRSQVHVAFILVLIFASANLASANPVCKCGNGDADSPSSSKKVVDYNVQITESGEQYNETIEVDTEKQTELFKVPAHRNVDHSNILHDFKTNMSMLLLPEAKICYLLPLDKKLSTPRKLISDLDEAQKPTSKTEIINNKWTVVGEMTDRSVLSDELANFCAKYPIYYMKKLEDSMTTTRIETGGKKTRPRRQWYPMYVRKIHNSLIPIPNTIAVCAGGKRWPSMSDVAYCAMQGKQWKVKCQIISETCYHIDVCVTVGNCVDQHVLNTIYCCQYVCIY